MSLLSMSLKVGVQITSLIPGSRSLCKFPKRLVKARAVLQSFWPLICQFKHNMLLIRDRNVDAFAFLQLQTPDYMSVKINSQPIL